MQVLADPAPVEPTAADLARHWTLEPGLHFLNHGSFGACPRPVLAAQQELRAELERQPVRFLARELGGRLDAARAELAAFLDADPLDLAAVPNATAGVNTVLRSLALADGDEVLTTDHEYNASQQRARVRRRAGRRPGRRGAGAVPDRLARRRGGGDPGGGRAAHPARPPRPRHQPDRARPPARAAGARAGGAGRRGAGRRRPRSGHAAARPRRARRGLLHRQLPQVAVRPQGRGLPLRPPRPPGGRSGRWRSATAPTPRAPAAAGFTPSSTGPAPTTPPPSSPCPAALRFLGGLLPGGWPAVRARNRALALAARDLLTDALGIAPPAPDEMIGSIAAAAAARRRPRRAAQRPLHRSSPDDACSTATGSRSRSPPGRGRRSGWCGSRRTSTTTSISTESSPAPCASCSVGDSRLGAGPRRPPGPAAAEPGGRPTVGQGQARQA